MNHFYKATYIIIVTLFLALPGLCVGQGFLEKKISLNAKNKPVSQVLKSIEAQGGFYFSYNSDIIGRDSLVTVALADKTVKEALDMLFGNAYEYNETGKYMIIQRASGQYWYASGYVVDGVTGEKVVNASVYEKQQLVSTLTNEQGYFRLKLKGKLQALTLYISRHLYFDTSVTVRSSNIQEISIGILPKPVELDSFVVRNNEVEKSWFSKLFLSSRQRVQSINLGQYFVNKPYQGSILPGIGTHGRMSAQVVNKFSFNLIGGYTAGVNGFEIGGVFNIVKHDVHYAQLAGAANIAGGDVNGVQIAGLYNQVLEASKGWQFAGLCNFVNDSLSGLQVAGVYNHIWGGTKGAQLSGVANFSKENVEGLQIAGVANYAGGEADGVQVAGVSNYANDDVDGVQVSGVSNFAGGKLSGTQVSGVVNYTHNLEGVQIGLVNVADTSSGIGIGLINFVWKGYHKLTISTNEVLNVNAALKLGNRRLYNIWFAGLNAGSFQKAYSFGYGWGLEENLSKHFTIDPELSAQHVYLGNWDHSNLLFKAQINLNYKINKYISLYVGPSFNVYYSDQVTFTDGYKKDVPDNGLFLTHYGNDWCSWVGWNAGITFF